MPATIHRFDTGETVTRGISRSGAGNVLSDLSAGFLKPIAARTGDLGIKYDNLSPAKKAGAIIATGAIALTAGGLVYNVVAGAVAHESAALVEYQDKVALGKHKLVSFKIDTNGKANVRSHAAKGGEDILLTMSGGQVVVCAPEVRTRDGQGITTRWAMIREPGGGYGFVNTDQNSNVQLIDNPAGCPEEATVAVNTSHGNFGGRYNVAVAEGGVLPQNFATIQK